MVVVLVAGVFAQGTPQTRPPLFLSESWKALSTPPDDHGAWPASQQGVANPNLQLTLHGTSGKEIQLVAVRGKRGRVSGQPVDRHDDVAERGYASRSKQLRRSHGPAGEDPLGCPHLRLSTRYVP